MKENISPLLNELEDADEAFKDCKSYYEKDKDYLSAQDYLEIIKNFLNKLDNMISTIQTIDAISFY